MSEGFNLADIIPPHFEGEDEQVELTLHFDHPEHGRIETTAVVTRRELAFLKGLERFGADHGLRMVRDTPTPPA